jgi:hypothetical protein
VFYIRGEFPLLACVWTLIADAITALLELLGENIALGAPVRVSVR